MSSYYFFVGLLSLSGDTVMTNLQRFSAFTGGIGALYHEAAFRLGLPDSEMGVLHTLLCFDGLCSIAEIRRQTGMRKQTLNSALRRLEHDDLIHLVRRTGRNKDVCLTEKGKRCAARSAGRLMAIEREALTSWSEEEFAQYLALSDRFLKRFNTLVRELSVQQSSGTE